MTESKPILELLQDAVDWTNGALPVAISKLGELKTAYEHIAQIVLKRQEKSPPKLSCWVWEHRRTGYAGGPIPGYIVAECRKIIPNGKWLFRDDGHYVKREGVEVREPVVCCSQRCADMYNRYRNDQKAKKLGAANSVTTGVELR